MLLLAQIDKRALYTNDRRCRLEEQPYRSLCITILEVTIETNHSVRTQYTLLACHLELHETTELHGFVDSAVHPNLYHRERNEQAAVYATADDSETTSVVVLSSISSSLPPSPSRIPLSASTAASPLLDAAPAGSLEVDLTKTLGLVFYCSNFVTVVEIVQFNSHLAATLKK